MAKAYDVFSLLTQKEREIRSSGQSWIQFLESSAYTSKYNFNDQLLIYANRPNARACASMEFWNKRYKRWVNKGAKGIPLLDMMDDGNYRMKYVFDVSDTHPTKYTEQDVRLFKFNEEDHLEALIAIENQVGIADGTSTDLHGRIIKISEKYSDLYQGDMIADIKQLAEDTYLEELDELNIELMSKKLLGNSVAFQIMKRLDLDPNSFFSGIDFGDITDFNDASLTSTLATTINEASTDFITDLDSEISKTKTRQKNVLNNIESSNEMVYNEDIENKTKIMSTIEGGRDDEHKDNGRDRVSSGERNIQSSSQDVSIRGEWGNLSTRGRNIDTEPTDSDQSRTASRDIRKSEETIFAREQASNVLNNDHQGNATDSFDGRGTTSPEIAGDGNTAVDGSTSSNRRFEERRSDEVGRAHEQHQADHRGDYLQGNHIQLEPLQLSLFPTEQKQIEIINETVEEESTVFSFAQMDIDDELRRGSGFENGKLRIYELFLNEPTRKEAADLLKNEYGVGGRSGSSDPTKVTSANHDSKGIVLTKGGYGDDRVDKLYRWSEVSKHIRNLIDNDLYLSSEEMTKYEQQEYQKMMDDPTILMNDEMKSSTPAMYETEDLALKDKVVQGIYFVPFRSNWSWYLVEYDEVTGDAFGLVTGDVPEWGYFNVRELHALGAQRLISHTPKTFEEIKDTELINQLTPFELSQVFSGELTFKSIEDEKIELSENEMTGLGEVDEITFGQLDHKLDDGKIDYRITDMKLGEWTNHEKLTNNIEAIRTLKLIEDDNRLATKEEQEILSKYVGWGGLADVFNEDGSSTWAMTAYGQVKRLLTDDEYKSARASTLNAHYTSPTIIEAMYDGLGILGFQTGNILEPSCGIGNFLGMMPEYFSESKFYGVELDSISGRISKQLYQNAEITIDGYENTNYTDNLFDVAIGNVPFGDYKVFDKRYDKENFLIHDYFFSKSLDKVRAGGIVAFITSKGTMDKKSSKVRKYLAERAELLGAIRLPNTAFKANAGTEVTSDIIFLKKRERPMVIDEDWIHLNQNEDGITMNQYFIDHPEMILGKMEMVSSRFGMESACLPFEDANLKNLLSVAVNNLSGSIGEISIVNEIEKSVEEILADPTVRNYSYTLVEGEVYFRENSVMIKPSIKDNDIPRLKDLIGIRDATRELVRLQMEDYSDEEIKGGQVILNQSYDDFVEKFGVINDKRNAKLFRDDVSYALICSLENIEHDKGIVTKADMFSKRTIKKRTIPERVDSPIEALALSISEKAKVDMDYMARLTGLPADEVFKDLQGIVFKNPLFHDGNYEEAYLNADEYISGNVREKHEVALSAAEDQPDLYSINVQALEKVIPIDLEATDIDVRLGATWLPVKDIEDFIFEILETPGYAKWDIKVRYSTFSANWNVEGKSQDRDNIKATMTYGTDRVSGYKIIEDSLNLKDTRVYDRVTDVDGKVKSVLNKQETMLAGQKQDALKEAFKEWIWQEPSRRNRLVKMYNEKFNSIRPREFDGSHISFEGMNPSIELREHQKNAIAHTLYGENTLLAHAVGAGKSFEMIASAMESKRLGLSQKSLFVVPNHLTEQMGSEFLKLYPSANILVSTKKEFEPKNRKKFCGRIATGDYDAVVIGHSQFERIPMSVERQQSEIERQIDAVSDGIADLKASSGDNFSVKQLEKTKKALSVRLLKLNDQSHKDDVVTFEELGVDRLIVDEAHSYKNLFLYTKMRNVAGIGQSEAKKSSDMFMKCRYMDEITNGKGIIFATGTPISNSMTELYTMQRYLQYGSLKKQNLEHFDAWASTFGETSTDIELSPEGTGYRPKTRFSKFYNLPELMNMFKEVADIKTADMLDLPIPEAEFETVVIQPSEFQQEMVSSLSERADMVRAKLVEPSEDNMLLITNDGRKLALDQRLMNPMLPRDDSGKVATCANNVFDIWEESADKKSTQLVFCDLSTPNGKGKFSVYDDIKTALSEKGIPENEIAFIHDAKNELQKDEMFAKVRSGDIRVLLGSTFKMGAGTNVQNKLIATHDLDCPWKPSDLEQRAGRLIRQGNENEKVKVFRYVTENTFDAYLWQLVENKQKFISQIMTSKSPMRSAEDADESTLSYAEIKALATGNPLIKEKMDLDVQVSKLKMFHSNYLSNKFALEDKIIKFYPNEIKRLETAIRGYQLDINRVKNNTVKGIDGERVFNGMTLNDVNYGQLDKEAAGKALLNSSKNIRNGKDNMIGSYRGFDLSLKYDSFFNQFYAILKGAIEHKVELGSDVYGNIARMDHVLDSIDSKLNDVDLKLGACKKQLKSAEIEVKKPFDKEKEMKEKVTRLSELDKRLNMAENEPIEQVSDLDIAKDYIMDFIANEYEEDREPFEFENLEKVDIAYTTTEDEKYGIQASVDLLNYTVNTYIDDHLVHTDKYGTLKELNEFALQHLDYGSLVFVEDEDIEKVEKLTIDKDTDLDSVIDRMGSDFRDSAVISNGDLDEREDTRASKDRPSILGQLKKNQENIKDNEVRMKSNRNEEYCL
jgi:N12 class adenine-specific DNA methylase